jgi:hypothetical protein
VIHTSYRVVSPVVVYSVCFLLTLWKCICYSTWRERGILIQLWLDDGLKYTRSGSAAGLLTSSFLNKEVPMWIPDRLSCRHSFFACDDGKHWNKRIYSMPKNRILPQCRFVCEVKCKVIPLLF